VVARVALEKPLPLPIIDAIHRRPVLGPATVLGIVLLQLGAGACRQQQEAGMAAPAPGATATAVAAPAKATATPAGSAARVAAAGGTARVAAAGGTARVAAAGGTARVAAAGGTARVAAAGGTAQASDAAAAVAGGGAAEPAARGTARGDAASAHVRLRGAYTVDKDARVVCAVYPNGDLQVSFQAPPGPQVVLRLPGYRGAGAYTAEARVRANYTGESSRQSRGPAQARLTVEEVARPEAGSLISGSFQGTYGGEAGTGEVAGSFERCVYAGITGDHG
jgi:hypothetical protein